MTEKEAIEAVRKYMKNHFPNQKEAANNFGVSQTYISRVISGEWKPNPEMFKAIGLIKQVNYVQGE